MKDPSKRFKYNCRKCPIRQRCIDEKSLGPGIKMTIARTFESRTDTIETWEMLQQDCLLIRKEKQQLAVQARPESGLLRRLRQVKQAQDPSLTAKPPPATPPKRRRPTTPRPSAGPAQVATCGLTVLSTQRLVRLPQGNEIVLGRFEPGFAGPPDVDLSFDDGEIPSVSRRHAMIIGRKGKHWIEDMGSSNGTYVNGYKLPLGASVQLESGNRLLLGRCRLRYAPLPQWSLEPDSQTPHTAILVVTHTGHRLDVPQQQQITVGRPDPSFGYAPDVDLSIAGDIALYVSRRHIRLTVRGGWHFLEEAGSASGTRLNGRPIRVGDAPVLLHPGDQMWLGGCVVAYEWVLV